MIYENISSRVPRIIEEWRRCENISFLRQQAGLEIALHGQICRGCFKDKGL